MPIKESVVFVFGISRRKDHFSGSQGFFVAPLSLSLNFDMVVNVDDGAEIFNLYDIRFLKSVFVVKVGIEDLDNVKVLKGNELLIIDELEAFDIFVSFYVVDDTLGVAEIIEDDLFPRVDLTLCDLTLFLFIGLATLSCS